MTPDEIVRRVDDITTDWNGARMVDGEPPRIVPPCGELRAIASAIRAERERMAENKGFQPDPVTAQSNDTAFLRRLVENVFSWALEDCNYLMAKDADAIITATRGGMTPEQAAVWRAITEPNHE